MKPRRLRARNLRTFPDLDLPLGAGVIGILGELRGGSESIDSNGAGKSTILEAIDICLFGRRSLAGYLTRGGTADELMVELTFEARVGTYRVRRTYVAKGRGKTSVDFERLQDGTEEWIPLTRSSAKETDDLICAAIGFSQRTFRESSYLRQRSRSYASADPADAKRLLVEAVLGSDPVWPKLEDTAKQRRKAAETQLERIGGETESLRELAGQAQTATLEARRAHDAVEDASRTLTAAEERHETAVTRHQQAREAGHARQTLEAELRAAENTVATLQKRDSDAETAAAALATARDEVAALATPEQLAALEERERAAEAALTETRDAVAAAERAARDRTEALDRQQQILDRATAAFEKAATLREQADHALAHIGDDRCDRCDQTLGAEAAATAAESLRQEADQLDQAAVALTAEAAAIEIPAVPEPADLDLVPAREQQHVLLTRDVAQARAQLQQRARLDERIAQLARAAGDRPTIDAIESAQAQAAAKRQLLDDLEPVDLHLLDQEHKAATIALETARTARETALAAAARADERLAQTKKAETQLAVLAAGAATIQKTIDRDLLLERACGRNGIPALIIENTAIPAIEAEADRILNLLGTGFTVELRTQTENKTGGIRGTLEIVVFDENGDQAEFEDGTSGGEQTRVELALKIALASFLTTSRSADSRVLMLDEPSFLDRAGMEALLRVLEDLAGRGVFDTILLVSHVAELRDALGETITVVREGGRSRIAGAPVPEAVAA